MNAKTSFIHRALSCLLAALLAVTLCPLAPQAAWAAEGDGTDASGACASADSSGNGTDATSTDSSGTTATPTDEATQQGYTHVFVTVSSNMTDKTGVSGLYKDNVFYVTLDDLCALSGATVDNQDNQTVVLTTSNGVRTIRIDVGSGNLTEWMFSDKFYATCPSARLDGQVYVSALHFLKYLGATVDVNPQGATKLTVFKRYDIQDAYGEMQAMDNGHFFWWDQVQDEDGDLEDLLVNAGVVALINQDPNFFRMMFDASGMERDALESILLEILKNEGATYFNEIDTSQEVALALDAASKASDAGGFLKETFSNSMVSDSALFDGFSIASLGLGISSDMVNAVDSVRQFDNMTAAQKNLLGNTILAYSDDSETLCNGWENILEAAKEVNANVNSAYNNEFTAVAETLVDSANDVWAAQGGTLFSGNPAQIAWDVAIKIYQVLPSSSDVIDRKTQLYNGYNASIIQLVADELLDDAWTDVTRANFLYTNVGDEYSALDRVKSAMVLRLKSTLTTRENLIESGFLSDDLASQMSQQCIEVAQLLSKVEGVQINGCNMFSPDYDDDLSWMQNTAVDYASAYYNQLVAQYGLADTSFTTTYQHGKLTGTGARPGDGGVSTVAAAPEQGNLGIVYKQIGDFDGNGSADLMLGRLYADSLEYTFAGQHDLSLSFTCYYFDQGPEPTEYPAYITSFRPAGTDTVFAFVDGSNFVLIRDTDDLGRTYEFTQDDAGYDPTRTYFYDNEITVYNLASDESWFNDGIYIHKDFRQSEASGREDVLYSLDVIGSDEGSRTFYAKNFTGSGSASAECSTEADGCNAVNSTLADLLGVQVGQMVPVSYAERDTVSFIPANLDALPAYVLLHTESSPKQWIAHDRAQGTMEITGTYHGL